MASLAVSPRFSWVDHSAQCQRRDTTSSKQASSFSEFKLQSAESNQHILIMSAEDSDLFFASCKNPPVPTKEMHDLMKEVSEWLK